MMDDQQQQQQETSSSGGGSRICGVCSDKALGYNFNALTCESCKAFFRRNALRDKIFTCISGSNKCDLTPKTRKYCRKCRLDKCLQIGMKKEWIMKENEKPVKRRKHRHAKISESDAVSSTAKNSSETVSQPVPTTNVSTPAANIIIVPIFPTVSNSLVPVESGQDLSSTAQERLIELINANLSIRNGSTTGQSNNLQLLAPPPPKVVSSSHRFTESITNSINDSYGISGSHKALAPAMILPSSSSASSSTDGISEQQPTITISKNVYEHAIRLEYMTNHLRPKSPVENHWTKPEAERLNELKRVFMPLYEVENQKLISGPSNMQTEEEGMIQLETAIKQLIMVIKNIRSFQNLCDVDRIVLMKGSITMIRSLLNIRSFNNRSDFFRRLNVEPLYTRCKGFVSSFRDDWKNDDLIINLLIMILMFFPNRDGLCHREYVKLEYLSYCHLLQRYLEMKYHSVCEAKSVYLNLLGRMEEMHYLNEDCIQMILMKFNPKYIGPLTFEVYDLDRKLKNNCQ